MNRGGGCSQRTPPPGTHFVALRGFSQELRRLFSPPSASAQRRFRCSQHRRVRMWTDQRESQTVLDHFDPPSWSPHPHPRHSSLLFCEASGAVFSSFCLNCLLQKLWMGSTWGPTALAVCLEYSLCFEGRVVDPDSSASFFFFFFHEAGMKSHLLSQLCPQQGLKGSFCCSRKKKKHLPRENFCVNIESESERDCASCICSPPKISVAQFPKDSTNHTIDDFAK